MPKFSLETIIADVNNRSNADFIKRLKEGKQRKTIPDWNNPNAVATHKLSYATDENNNAIVYPEVQNINNELHDFTDPKYKHKKWDALDSAIERGDTIIMSPSEAELFTKNYKKYYQSFDY